MKNALVISLLIMIGPGIAVAQTDREPTTATSTTRNEDHNWGWMGLLGLAGLAGLRRKSEIHSKLEAQGVNVKSVGA